MHDPMTVAFEIKWPWKRHDYRPSFITIWHVDPERDGTDDSCGWFMRSRHGSEAILKRIESDFAFHWDRDRICWFDSLTGLPQCSTLSIVLAMFRVAARAVHQGEWFDPYGWRGSDRLMRRRLYDILSFAENTLDSMRPFVEQLYGPSTDTRAERIHEAASIIYGCLLRWERPWYRHPKWHIWHWRLQVHPLMHLKRWLFSRCAGCGRRFSYGYAPLSTSWDGSGPLWFRSERHVYHSECDPSVKR